MRYSTDDKPVYDGDWRDDKRNGKGKMMWPNGHTYEGDFVDGYRTGKS